MKASAAKKPGGRKGDGNKGVIEAAGLKKQFLKGRPACKVTFNLPKEAVPNARKVNIVGDFNKWDKEATEMKKLKDGGFSVTIELETNRQYRFKYLVDDSRWENDWNADRYEPNPFGDEDSIVVL